MTLQFEELTALLKRLYSFKLSNNEPILAAEICNSHEKIIILNLKKNDKKKGTIVNPGSNSVNRGLLKNVNSLQLKSIKERDVVELGSDV